jgi:hypothetical protein
MFNIQIDDLVREATEDETAFIKKQQSEEAKKLKAQADQVLLKESANAKLLELGLTEAEVSALVR